MNDFDRQDGMNTPEEQKNIWSDEEKAAEQQAENHRPVQEHSAVPNDMPISNDLEKVRWLPEVKHTWMQVVRKYSIPIRVMLIR